MSRLVVNHFNDPGCPYGYSVSPALAVLRWRYGGQLEWRTITIGLAESPRRYVEAGYTPTRSTLGYQRFRRHGMPFLMEPRERVLATSRACRAIVAARLRHPGSEEDVLRALQLGWFTTTLLLDEDDAIEAALGAVPGLDAGAIVAAIDDPETISAYERDRELARRAAGSPTAAQGKARQTDGPVRYSAPSVVFQAPDGRRLEAGGFQTIEAYDVLVVNLDPAIERRAEAAGALEALEAFPGGLVTQEVAAVMAPNNTPPDRAGAERELVALLGEGRVCRRPLADDALWLAA
ncbi:MAG TPA: DsbA family protein [Solirubrobacteraceae bacterium]|nr:DsbA family protein [Solirubrobacteraceae bacterium]